MKIVFLSDTHSRHSRIDVPPGDVLVHTGDFSKRGESGEVIAFLTWFASQPHSHKVLIAGNHDFLAERSPEVFRELIPPGVTYLEDQLAEVAGLRIWGSPVTPWFHSWAFNRRRGEEIARHWARIPEGIDLLAVHGPPAGVLDVTVRGEAVGCHDLAQRIAGVRPRIVAFGHIHERYGSEVREGITYVNSCVLDVSYRVVNRPIVLDWPLAGDPPLRQAEGSPSA